MKKTWIKIKRGLLTAKHRECLGVRIWLLMYMYDRTDWETGTIYGWKDKHEADDFGMSWRTLQQQRQKLEKDGYISCYQGYQAQTIIIHKWINPREYSGKVLHSTPKGTDINVSISEEDTNHGTQHGTNHPYKELSTPSIDSQDTDHSSLKDDGKPPPSPSPKNQKNQVRKALELHFIEVTKLFPPKMDTAKQKRAAGTKWWGPLRDIAELVEWNESDGKALISNTIERLNGMTISDPNSILNTANAVWSEKQRQAPSKESHPLWKFGDPYPGQ